MDHGTLVSDAFQALSRCLGTTSSDTQLLKCSKSGNVLLSLRVADTFVIAKLCRGDYPYEAGIYEVLAGERQDESVAPRLLGQCESPNGLGQWLFCEMGEGVSGDHVRRNLSRYLAKLRHVHRLPTRPFETALPGRYGRMGRRQWSRQLLTNLELIACLGDRLGIDVAVDPADWCNRLDWMADVRYCAPATLVHGDACLDNWIVMRGDVRLVDWELARIDDPLVDVQALTLFMSEEAALDAVRSSVAADEDAPAGAQFRERFSVARAEYCIRLAAWFLGRAATRDLATEGAGRFTGLLDRPPEGPASLAKRALEALRAQQAMARE